jgi:hypothetical protein
MVIGLADKTNGTAITNGSFSVPYSNSGGGWYVVFAQPNTWVYASAYDYNQAGANTDAYSSMRIYMSPHWQTKK